MIYQYNIVMEYQIGRRFRPIPINAYKLAAQLQIIVLCYIFQTFLHRDNINTKSKQLLLSFYSAQLIISTISKGKHTPL